MRVFANFPEQTPVLFKPYPNAREESQGIILRNCGGGVCAVLVYVHNSGGFNAELRENCYYADDSRIQKFSSEFWEDDAGVFRLAPLAVSIDAALDNLQSQIEALRDDEAQTEQAFPEKRRRGRPSNAEIEARRLAAATETDSELP